jgi:hypothetical protein
MHEICANGDLAYCLRCFTRNICYACLLVHYLFNSLLGTGEGS